jgi:iron complex transport system substrate-binding protein
MRRKMLAGLIAGLTLLAASCGEDDEDTSEAGATTAATADATTAPATTAPSDTDSTATGPTTATTEPMATGDVYDQIISLSPTATEMLYAIGAGDQVIAVDDFSNYPEEAQAKMTGLSGYEPNLEAIAGLEPDLVVTDGTNPDLLAGLDSLDIAHWEGPAAVTVDDSYEQLEQLGAMTGHLGDAEEVVAQMQSDIAELTASMPELEEPLTYYHELDDSYFSVTSDTFIGSVYSMAGLRNIADLAETAAGPYPQLNAEFIIASDPDLIFLACTKYCGTDAASVAARPGWADISAVRDEAVVEMDDDIASRWGPRIVDYLRAVRDAVEQVTEVQPAG